MFQDSDFDKVADEYDDIVDSSLEIYGLGKADAALRRVKECVFLVRENKLVLPRRILDFGCGVGGHLPILRQAFPDAELFGIDTSKKSIDLAQEQFKDIATLMSYEGNRIPSELRDIDLVVFANVFHHIRREDHRRTLMMLRAVVSPNAVLMMFEHNPANPVTRKIVRDCPLDKGVRLLWPAYSKRLFISAGINSPQTRFILFSPFRSSRLMKLEHFLAKCPLGAQYLIFGQFQ